MLLIFAFSNLAINIEIMSKYHNKNINHVILVLALPYYISHYSLVLVYLVKKKFKNLHNKIYDTSVITSSKFLILIHEIIFTLVEGTCLKTNRFYYKTRNF